MHCHDSYCRGFNKKKERGGRRERREKKEQRSNFASSVNAFREHVHNLQLFWTYAHVRLREASVPKCGVERRSENKFKLILLSSPPLPLSLHLYFSKMLPGSSAFAARFGSKTLEEASRKAVALYRKALREIPSLIRNYNLELSPSYMRHVIRADFDKVRNKLSWLSSLPSLSLL